LPDRRITRIDPAAATVGSVTFRSLLWRGREHQLTSFAIFAACEAREQARERTAELRIEDVSLSPHDLDVKVRVTNLAGHKLPSGVGFRRAFLELAVLDVSGEVLWCSG
jgi:hypothetical protein